MHLRIDEEDGTGNLTATYIESRSNGNGRVDIIVSFAISTFLDETFVWLMHTMKESKGTSSLWSRVLSVFLPAGYPHSVTKDYMW